MDELTDRKKYPDTTSAGASTASFGLKRWRIIVLWVCVVLLLLASDDLVPGFVRLLSALGVGNILAGLLALLLPYTVAGIACIGYGLLIPRHRLRACMADGRAWDWALLWTSGGVYAGSIILFTLIHWHLVPSAYTLTPRTMGFGTILAIWLASLALLPLQTSVEELLFRILPARLFAPRSLPKTWPGRVALSLFSAGFFILPHLTNPEVLAAGSPVPLLSFYALFGFGAMYLSLVHGGFETALGIHAANNLLTALFVSYPVSVLPAHPLLLAQGKADSWLTVIQLAVSLTVVFFVSYLRARPAAGPGPTYPSSAS